MRYLARFLERKVRLVFRGHRSRLIKRLDDIAARDGIRTDRGRRVRRDIPPYETAAAENDDDRDDKLEIVR